MAGTGGTARPLPVPEGSLNFHRYPAGVGNNWITLKLITRMQGLTAVLYSLSSLTFFSEAFSAFFFSIIASTSFRSGAISASVSALLIRPANFLSF